MAEYKVIKEVKDVKTGEKIAVGTVIERTVKEVTAFEKKHGNEYLERLDGKE